MKRFLPLFLGLLWTTSAALAEEKSSAFAVVEVFTSEGCSSCPPAESVLGQVVHQAALKGLPVYALEWHVDYWDYLGWKDPYGSSYATQRQYAYSRALPSSVYTPQAVINGTLVPSYAGDLDEVEKGVQGFLAKTGSTRIQVSVDSVAANSVSLNVVSQGVPRGAGLLLALVEDGLTSLPKAGENSGRKLSHTHVVRAVLAPATQAGSFTFKMPSGIDTSRSSFVALLQDPKTFQIYAASRADFPEAVSSLPGQFGGRLTDSAGKGLGQVPLQACSAQVCVPGRTDSSGNFLFSSLPPGNYSLTVGDQADVFEMKLEAGQRMILSAPLVLSGVDKPFS